MVNYENLTLQYYERYAEKFINSTLHADVTELYQVFEEYVKPQGKILDLGCGTGRDSKYFISNGYTVEAVDGSKRMCEFASYYIGKEVYNVRFKDVEYDNEFDGIWACASLLHVSKSDLHDVMRRIRRALKNKGIAYISFKYGNGVKIREGRYFNNYTENTIEEFFEREQGFHILKTYVTGDVRDDRKGEKWINVIVMKDEPWMK